jgi:hypothetical protein
MIITTLTPIIVGTVLSFFFKSTRPMGIIGVTVMSYFYPVVFLVVGIVGGLGYLYWRYRKG